MKNLLALLLAGAYSIIAGGPGSALPFERAVLTLSGASSLEELSESEVERYETFLSHPLQINLAPRSKLLSCGLMSRYQVASLCDYRERTGDVLGVTELSFVDGFGPETAAALACFVGFESRSAPGSRPYSRLKQSALLRSGIKAQGQEGAALSGYGFKYTMEYGQRAGFRWSGRDGTMPGTFSLALCGRGSQVLVLGDFNARFGQGLALWSGMSLSGFSGTGAFVRNGSGLSPTGSFSPSHRGGGFETGIGPWTFSAALSVPGLRERCDGLSGTPLSFMPMVACSWLGKYSNAGIQAYLQTGELIGGGDNVLGISRAAATVDFRAGIGKWTVYGEGGWGISRVLNTYRNSSGSGDMYVKVVENKALLDCWGQCGPRLGRDAWLCSQGAILQASRALIRARRARLQRWATSKDSHLDSRSGRCRSRSTPPGIPQPGPASSRPWRCCRRRSKRAPPYCLPPCAGAKG